MSSTTTITTTEQPQPSLTLRPKADEQEAYKYKHLLPVFVHNTLPPLTPFEHVDPGRRALPHEKPRAFLDAATSIVDLTPHLGTEVRGVDLTKLDSTGRDQLALEVTTVETYFIWIPFIIATGRPPRAARLQRPSIFYRCSAKLLS